MAAIDPPAPQSFDAGLVKRGRELAAIGNCNDCHTVRGGKSFAGGLPVPTPFGTIYSSNITPDAETGIGRWSEAAFRRAMRSGVNREGQHLYPTFPYDHFTNVSDEDDAALYAYLMTRPPVQAPARENRLPFPLDQRPVIAGWKLLFLHRGSYQPDRRRARNGIAAPIWSKGWRIAAPAIPRAMRWERNEPARPLPAVTSITGAPLPSTRSRRRRCRGMRKPCSPICETGSHPDHGAARGPMAEVVSNLSSVPESDVRAIATYMAGVFGAPTPDRKRQGDQVVADAKSFHQVVADAVALRAGFAGKCRRRIDLRRGLCHVP